LRKEALRRQFGVDFYSGDVDWWIKTELQNRFRLKSEMEFGILGSDDGLAGFLGWKSFWGYRLGLSNLFFDKWIRAS
jgi:hypothetical protein